MAVNEFDHGWIARIPTGSGGVSDGDKGDVIVSGGGASWALDTTNSYTMVNLALTGAQIRDTNGNELVIFSPTASAVNEVTISNAATGGNPTIAASGGDANIGLVLDAKGTGAIRFADAAVPNASDGAALGTTALQWSDLFLASGGVINFNNGAYTSTEASAIVTHLSDIDENYHTKWSSTRAANPTQTFGIFMNSNGVSLGTETNNQLGFFTNNGSVAAKLNTDNSWTPGTNDASALGTTALQWSDLFLASGGVINWNNGDATITHSSDALTVGGSEWILSAGTTTIAPLKFQSGTNLTTAEAGAFEYDGTVFYSSTNASQRGLSPSVLFTHCGGNYTLTAGSGVQSAFTAAQDTLTVEASTTYFFEALYMISNGTTTHTTATAFGGTATYNSVEYVATLWSAAANTISTTQSTTHVTGAASKVLNATSAAAATTIQLQGTIAVNAAGTIIPQINFSANPGGTNLMLRGSYFRMYRIGAAAPTFVGNWA